MDATLEKTLSEKIKALPGALRNVLLSREKDSVIEEVMPMPPFSPETRVKLNEVTLRVALGMTHPEDFTREVRNIDGIEDIEDAAGVAQEINRRIFLPVRAELQKVYGVDVVALIERTVPEEIRIPIPGEPPAGTSQTTLPRPTSLLSSVPPQPGLPPPPPPRREVPRTVPDEVIRALLDIGRGTPYEREALEDAYRKVPDEVRRAVTSVDVRETLRRIGEKFALHIDKMGELASESGLLMIGLTHPGEFVRNLARRLAVSDDEARKIGEEVNTEVFRPVRESLKRIYESTNETNVRMAANEKGRMQYTARRPVEATAPPVPKARFMNVAEGRESIVTAEAAPVTVPRSGRQEWVGQGQEVRSMPARQSIGAGGKYEVGMGREGEIGSKNQEPNQKIEEKEPQQVSTPEKNEQVQRQNIQGGNTEVHDSHFMIHNSAPTPPRETRFVATPVQPPTPPWEERKRRLLGDAGSEEERAEVFTEEKLTEPTKSPSEEKRYTVDPYRESID